MTASFPNRLLFTLLMGFVASFSLGSTAQPQAFHVDDFDCIVEANSTVRVGSQVSGVVSEFFVDRGDKVELGQMLFRLEDSLERSELEIARSKSSNREPVASAEVQLELARANAKRLSDIRSRNAAALNEVQLSQALADAKIAEINLRNAEINLRIAALEETRASSLLSLKSIKSPIDGVVIERLLSAGEYRNDQSDVLVLAALDPLYAEAFLPKQYFGKVAIGDSATVTLESPLATDHKAIVSVVDPIIDAASGTFGVRLLLPNPEYAIPAGLRCTLRFTRAN